MVKVTILNRSRICILKVSLLLIWASLKPVLSPSLLTRGTVNYWATGWWRDDLSWWWPWWLIGGEFSGGSLRGGETTAQQVLKWWKGGGGWGRNRGRNFGRGRHAYELSFNFSIVTFITIKLLFLFSTSLVMLLSGLKIRRPKLKYHRLLYYWYQPLITIIKPKIQLFCLSCLGVNVV